jgi:hypothetical protein
MFNNFIEVAMKKLILTLSLLLCATTSLLNAGAVQHIPTDGPVQLGDLPASMGIIKDIISNDASFYEERNAINSFITQQNLINPTYQDMVTRIGFTQGCIAGGLEVLEAFERAIMYYIHQQNYFVSFEDKWLNIFVKGIQKPTCWFTDNRMLRQCMNELSILAQITEKYSAISSMRMQATVESYLHWRRNMAIAAGTYLIANGIFRRDFKKSPLGLLIHGGLMNSPKIITQFKDDVVDFSTAIGNWVQPIINGFGIFDKTAQTTQKAQPSLKAQSLSKESLYNNLKNKIFDYNKKIYDSYSNFTTTKKSNDSCLSLRTTIPNKTNKPYVYSNQIAEEINQWCADYKKNYDQEKMKGRIKEITPCDPF